MKTTVALGALCLGTLASAMPFPRGDTGFARHGLAARSPMFPHPGPYGYAMVPPHPPPPYPMVSQHQPAPYPTAPQHAPTPAPHAVSNQHADLTPDERELIFQLRELSGKPVPPPGMHGRPVLVKDPNVPAHYGKLRTDWWWAWQRVKGNKTKRPPMYADPPTTAQWTPQHNPQPSAYPQNNPVPQPSPYLHNPYAQPSPYPQHNPFQQPSPYAHGAYPQPSPYYPQPSPNPPPRPQRRPSVFIPDPYMWN